MSDRCYRGEQVDEAGPALHEALTRAGFELSQPALVPDEPAAITAVLRALADEADEALVLTTGGTGFAPRDVTPEATRAVIEREAPGLPEVMRAATLGKTRRAMLSRGVAGIRRRTLYINLPGSPKGAVECFEAIASELPHALEILRGGMAGHGGSG